jgi:hypothetical protein
VLSQFLGRLRQKFKGGLPSPQTGTEETKEAKARDQRVVIRDWGLKTAGAIIGGLGTAGALVVIGSAVLWVRFEEAGLPPVQAVSVQPRQEALVQGAEVAIAAVLAAIGLVAFLYMLDRRLPGRDSAAQQEKTQAGELGNEEKAGERTNERKQGECTKEESSSHDRPIELRTKIGLCIGLPAGAILYLVLAPDISPLAIVGLLILAGLLTGACFWVGISDEKSFWALAAAVFVSAIVFSGAAGYLIVKEQKSVQAVAILRDKEDAGVTGFYVATSDKKVYFANSIGNDGDEPRQKPIQEVPIGEETTYAIGPLESPERAAKRARSMLRRLVVIRAAHPGAHLPDPEKEKAKIRSKKAALAVERITNAFQKQVSISRRVVTRNPLCLVHYGDSVGMARGHWWTSCAQAKKLGDVANIREKLGMRELGSLDMRVNGRVPVGTRLVALRGRAAPRCEHGRGRQCGHQYGGGGALYYVADPTVVTVTDRSCTTAREDRPPAWKPCPR